MLHFHRGEPALFDAVLSFVGKKDAAVQDGEGLTPLHAIMEQLQVSKNDC